MRRPVFSLLLAALAVAPFSPVSAAETDSAALRERLNKILYWSMSDELKLSPQQEKQMIGIIEGLQQKREVAYRDREEALNSLRKLGKEPTAKAVEAPLARYQKSVEELARLDAEEYRQLMPLLGAQTLARFYIIRDDVAQKVRGALKNEKK
jgi:hypothetical protein